jgi:hypothetical protein
MAVSEGFKIDSEHGHRPSITRRPLIWLSCLCLDAPVVAGAWQALFAKAFHHQLPAADRLALFLTAWWIYLADRLADSLTAPPSAVLTARAAFCLRHKRMFSLALAAVGLADAIVIVTALAEPLIKAGALLGGLAFVYLLVNFRYDRIWRAFPIKELAVGFLFASGTSLVFLTVFPQFSVFAAVFLFGCVCSLNCLSIAVWEKDVDLGQGKRSGATEHPRWMGLVRPGCLVIGIISCALGGRVVPSLMAAGLATSSGLLLLLHLVEVRKDERTALADMAVLVPAVIFIAPDLW